MAIVRFDIDQELDEIRRDMGRMLSGFPRLTQLPLVGTATWSPQMDSVVEDGRLVVRLDVPGMTPGDADVQVMDNELVISGTRTIERDRDAGEWFRHERLDGSFERRLTLPEDIDPLLVSATFAQGVLTVTVPLPEARQPRHVPITTTAD